jgi:acylpyruvate hydrolase
MVAVRLRGEEEPIPVGKIVCVGANYGRHISEMGRQTEERTEPMLFFKPPTALVRDRGIIHYPDFSNELHHELEMVLLIGSDGWRIPEEAAVDYVAGLGVGIDLTARDRQREAMQKGYPWAICKGFDDSAPVSDFIPLRPGIDPDDLKMTLKVNGELRQEGTTSDMLLSSGRLISAVSRYFRLERGDLLFTGTPEGVGPLQRGDAVEIELEGLIKARFTIEEPRRSKPAGT